MKKKFLKLSKRNKYILIFSIYLISLVMLVLLSYFEDDEIQGFLSTMFLVSLVIAITLNVWLKNENKPIKENKSLDSKITKTSTGVRQVKIFNSALDPIKNDYFLRWTKKEKIASLQNLNLIDPLNSSFKFVEEDENEHDSNPIALFADDNKVGYFYNTGDIKSMITKYQNKEDYKIEIKLHKFDKDNNELTLLIGFYKYIDENNIEKIESSLSKTAKKIDEYENRQDNIEMISEGDWVFIEVDYNDYGEEIYIVVDDMGNELGEITSALSKRLKEKSKIEYIAGKIKEIDVSSSGTLVPIVIFYILR